MPIAVPHAFLRGGTTHHHQQQHSLASQQAGRHNIEVFWQGLMTLLWSGRYRRGIVSRLIDITGSQSIASDGWDRRLQRYCGGIITE